MVCTHFSAYFYYDYVYARKKKKIITNRVFLYIFQGYIALRTMYIYGGGGGAAYERLHTKKHEKSAEKKPLAYEGKGQKYSIVGSRKYKCP